MTASEFGLGQSTLLRDISDMRDRNRQLHTDKEILDKVQGAGGMLGLTRSFTGALQQAEDLENILIGIEAQKQQSGLQKAQALVIAPPLPKKILNLLCEGASASAGVAAEGRAS